MATAITLFCIAVFCTPSQSAPRPLRYQVTDMGNLGGEESVAYAINNRGQLVGGADTGVRGRDGEFDTYVFLWSGGVKHKINALPGRHYYATGINDAGQIVGAYSARPEGGIYVPFLYVGGHVRLLPTLPRPAPLFANTAANAINNAAVIAGESSSQACVWKGGHVRGLPMPKGYTETRALAINAGGVIIGWGTGPGLGGFRSRALEWGGGRVTELVTLPGSGDAWANGVNNSGIVVGWTNQPGTPFYRAVVWRNGRAQPLPQLPRITNTRAYAINNRGDIVGRYVLHVVSKSNERGVLWHDGKIYNLGDLIPRNSGWVLEEPLAINDHGWIIGNGKHNGVARAFLLRPT